MTEILDAVGVQLALGQRVVYATAGMHATGQLVPGTVVSLCRVPDGDWPREVSAGMMAKSSTSAGPSAFRSYARSRRQRAGCAGSSLCSARADDQSSRIIGRNPRTGRGQQ